MLDHIQIVSKGLDRDTCHLIMRKFFHAKMTEVTLSNYVATPVNVEEEDRLKYFDVYGRLCYSIGPSNKDFTSIIDFIDYLLPKSDDFARISYMQIIQYPVDTFIGFHKDIAEEDSGTAIFFLNDDFEGGKLIVDNIIVTPSQGTMVAFNNSTQRWHGTEPVYKGDRFVLALWFDRGSPEDFDEFHAEDDMSSQKLEPQDIPQTYKINE